MPKQGAVFCAAYVPENPQGECGHAMPCPRHARILGADIPVNDEPQPEGCPAHGLTSDQHTGELAQDCCRPVPFAPHGTCPSCGTYALHGWHWDTCEYRGRNRADKGEPSFAPRVPSLLWSSQPDVELQALTEIVAALARLTPPTRARCLRYLNARYEPSAVIQRGPGSAPPA